MTIQLCKERSEVETKATRGEILDCREEINEREATGKAGLTRLILKHPLLNKLTSEIQPT